MSRNITVKNIGCYGLSIAKICFFSVFFIVLTGCMSDESKVTVKSKFADTVYKNGRIHTVDGDNQVVEAIAIKDGVILSLGVNEEIEKYISESTEVIDLNDKMMMPGLVDAHMHTLGGGAQLTSCSLKYQSLTVDEALAIIRGCLEEEGSPKNWLQVQGWFRQAMKPAGADLNAATLDRISTSVPIVVMASDYHTLAANTAAMNAAGIDQKSQDPSDGKIVRDENGMPTGIFLDGAMWMVSAGAPKLTEDEEKKKNIEYITAAISALNSQGVTTIFDAAADEKTAEAFNAVRENSDLNVRVRLAKVISPEVASTPDKAISSIKVIADKFNVKDEATAPGINLSTAKLFVDGVIQAPAQTGMLVEPYLHNTGSHDHPNWQPSDKYGSLYFDEKTLTNLLDVLVANNLDAHMHTTGDKAIQVALNSIEAVRQKTGVSKFRPALAHNELIKPEDYPRFSKLNAMPVLSLQWGKPAPDTIDSVKDYIGVERFPYLETSGKFQQAGARVVFGSDWPIDPLNEWLAMEIAITRSNTSDLGTKYQGRLGDDPGLTIEQALRAFTTNGAYLLKMDRYIGSLEVGKYADLIVLDQDVTAIDPNKISEANVILTVVGGREVYRSDKF